MTVPEVRTEDNSVQYCGNFEIKQPIDNPKTLVTAWELLQRPKRETRFLISPRLLPEKGLCIIAAQNETGKSAFALYLAGQLVAGKPLFGFTKRHHGDRKTYGDPSFPTQQVQRILYVDYELSAEIRTERLAALRTAQSYTSNELDRISFPEVPSDYKLENRRNGTDLPYRNLEEEVKRIQPQVLIIDPLSSSHFSNENTYEMAAVLGNATRLRDLYGTAVILIHHCSTKLERDSRGVVVQKSGKELNRGWSGITDWADCAMTLHTMPKPSGLSKSEKVIEIEFSKVRQGAPQRSRLIVFDLAKMTVRPFEGKVAADEDE